MTTDLEYNRKNGSTYSARDFHLNSLGFKSYRDYLDSGLWKSIKVKVEKAKGTLCVLCRGEAECFHHTILQRGS